MAQGYLQVDVVSEANNYPVTEAEVTIAKRDEPERILEEVRVNSSGQTENLSLDAPDPALSLRPGTEKPYAEYTVRIRARGFETLVINGTEVLAGATAIQTARLRPLSLLPEPTAQSRNGTGQETGKEEAQGTEAAQGTAIAQETTSAQGTATVQETATAQGTTIAQGTAPGSEAEAETDRETGTTPKTEAEPAAETETAAGTEPVTGIESAAGTEPITGIESAAGIEPTTGIESRPAPETEIINIPAHTLYGDYPEKLAEAEIKPIRESGEIVLSRVVVPQTIVVHDGVPSNKQAKDYYVPYRDYIKNVASSEIYATWPQAAIIANVLAIMSFTLNRVYTEWYRNQGYDFTITSSTAYDHKWIYGRNIYESISVAVDEIFDNYLSRPDVKQPILTQYCDGRKVTCPGWMTQWGSCELGEQGYSPIEILRYFYGDDIYINTAEQISGIPASWPGEALTIGSSGDKVRQLQEQLDVIATIYSAIPRVTADGIYGPATAASVKEFQSVFGLPQTGVTDFSTWYKISHIYVGVTRIAELS